MGKRVSTDEEKSEPSSKRQKLLDDTTNVNQPPVEIQSGKQLRQLLLFQQDGGPTLRSHISSFKAFLEVIAYGEENDDRTAKQSVLLEFLESQIPTKDDKKSLYLSDLIQTWSFAAQSNHEALLSAVPAVLALLLKTISKLIDFRECGVRLCEVLLRKDQIDLFNTNLAASKSKEFLISPCLRLLTEIVSFDGGTLAKRLYLQRDVCFKRLEVFLGMQKPAKAKRLGRPSKPSVRLNALRYLLANLRFQDQVATSDILCQAKLVRGLFQDIKDDMPNVIREILNSIKKYVVNDTTLSRTTRSRLLTDWTLSRVASLDNYEEGEQDIPEGQLSVKDSAFEFLVYVCTTPDHGVLLSQHGWYFPGSETAVRDLDATDNPLRHGRQTSSDKSTENISVRNTTLSRFLQTLRPYASTFHRDLTLAAFEAAPELVADYFSKKKTFSFEPKLSATWIGYSAFLFSVVKLPAPIDGIGEVLPPVSIVIESILPQPLTQKSLTRCLNQSSTLVTFFAANILTIAFQKLEIVLEHLRSKVQPTAEFDQAQSKLKAEFCRRCPELKQAVATFRGCSPKSVNLKDSLLRLLAMYYKIVPQIALDAKFDISIALSKTLSDVADQKENRVDSGMRLLELDHLLDIAHTSPNMQWWQKPENMRLSPFTSILQLHASTTSECSGGNVRKLLQSIVKDYALLQQDTERSALDAIIVSLRDFRGWQASAELYDFLDNCILRLVRKTIKYFGDAVELEKNIITTSANDGTRPVSLLLMAILEQWPYFIGACQASDLTNVLTWLARYFTVLQSIGEDHEMLGIIFDRLGDHIKDKDNLTISKIASELLNDTEWKATMSNSLRAESKISIDKTIFREDPKDQLSIPIPILPPGPPEEAEEHSGLIRWTKKEPAEAIEDGAIADLLLCLCSKHAEIRKQSLSNIETFMAKLEFSGYSESQQIYLLLGEVTETARGVISSTPYPYFAGIFAAHSISVLSNPLHFMYTKINKFLNRSPIWNTAKLPSYWMDKVFLDQPTQDDAHLREVEWVINALLEGLRTPKDMDHYRRCKVFERLLSSCSASSIARKFADLIIKLLFRCTYVGGSTTLLTRCAILSWTKACIVRENMDSAVLELLYTQVIKTCEDGRVSEWAKGITLNPN